MGFQTMIYAQNFASNFKFAIGHVVKRLIRVTPVMAVLEVINIIFFEKMNIFRMFAELFIILAFFMFLVIVNACLNH